MNDSILDALRPLAARVLSYVAGQPELREELTALARAFLASAEVPVSASPGPIAPIIEPTASPSISVPIEPSKPKEPAFDGPTLFPLIAARAPVPAGFYEPPQREFLPLPLLTVAQRCWIKSAAAKLQASRAGGTSLIETEAEEARLRQQADQIPDCGLWMFESNASKMPRKLWDDLSGGYGVSATAAEVLKAWNASGPDLAHGQEVLTLCAEAQSMLLYAVADIGWVNRDHEQVQLFVHIRELGKLHQIYVPRYLRREDPADPSRWADLQKRMSPLLARYNGLAVHHTVTASIGIAGDTAHPAPSVQAVPLDPAKVRAKALGNLKYKLRKLADEDATVDEEWPRLVELLDQAVSAGVPPSSLELREMLLPVYDRLPRELNVPAPVERVFRAIELHRDSQAIDDHAIEDDVPAPHVAQVADWLRGKELVLIGGQRRPHHVNALKRIFGLADVRWISTPEHSSFTVFEADIARSEVAAVLLAIRWSSHDYASVQQYCTKYGKPLVRLTAGYNTNQVAHQIQQQAGERLAASANEGFAAGL